MSGKTARLPLAQLPHASVHERVRGFVADQQKRVGQYAAEGRAVMGATSAQAAQTRLPELAQGSPLLQARVPHSHERAAPVRDERERENLEPRPKEDRGLDRRARKRDPPDPSKQVAAQPSDSDDVEERDARLAERRERRRAKAAILKPRAQVAATLEDDSEEDVGTSKKKRKSKKTPTLPAGLALMQNFSAKNITKDRLTLRPGQSLGIFNKGKASAKTRTKGGRVGVFDELAFMNKRRRDEQDDSSSQSSHPPKTSRFFARPDTPTSRHIEKKRGDKRENPHESEPECQDSQRRRSKTPSAGAASIIWSIEREFLEQQAGTAEPIALSRRGSPEEPPRRGFGRNDDARSVLTMNTEYRKALPMCADISSFAMAQSRRATSAQPQFHAVSPRQPTHDKDHNLEGHREGSSMDDRRSRPASPACRPYAEDAPSDLLCSDVGLLQPRPQSRVLDDGQSDTTDRLLHDIDYLLASTRQPPAAPEQWQSLYWTEVNQRDVMDIDAVEPELDEPEIFLNDFGPPAEDDDPTLVPALAWDADLGQFVVMHDEFSPLVRTPIEEVFDVGDDATMDGYFEGWGRPEWAQAEDDSYLEQVQTSSNIEDTSDGGGGEDMVLPAFSEGRALLLGFGTCAGAKEEDTVKFEWHPYRLG